MSVVRAKLKSGGLPPKSVTLADIGREAGVSFSVVSRVLGDRPDRIPEETRNRVRAAAKRLGYRRNLLIRGVQTGRSMNIGVVVPPTGSFYSRIVHGIHDELRREGYCILLAWNPIEEADGDNSMEQDLIHSLVDRRVDGVVLRPTVSNVSDLYFSEVQERHIPLVTVDRPLPGVHCDFAGADDENGARIATRHLLEIGHRKIVHLYAESPFENADLRRKGFEEECAAVSSVEAKVVKFPRSSGLSKIEKSTLKLLSSSQRPTALFLASDNMAPAVYRAAVHLGLRIPDDLSLIGFGNLDQDQFAIPPLSSIDQDPYAIGLNATRIILSRINGNMEKVVRRLVVPKLVLRESTAPVK
jgi:LacI family transcriptional regulator